MCRDLHAERCAVGMQQDAGARVQRHAWSDVGERSADLPQSEGGSEAAHLVLDVLGGLTVGPRGRVREEHDSEGVAPAVGADPRPDREGGQQPGRYGKRLRASGR